MGKIVRWAILGFFTLVTLAPLLWLLLSSFKTDAELFAGPFALPQSWNLDNYADALRLRPMGLFLKNSLIASAVSGVLIIVASLMAAYALLHRFRLSKTTFGFLVFGILLPVNALIVPIFYLVNSLGLYNSIWGLVLVYSGLFLPLGFLVVKVYMDTTPLEIFEAARIDGAGFHRTFLSVAAPLTAPGAATAGILIMINAWNELIFAQILTQDAEAQTVQVGMRYFLTTYNANYPLAFAATVIAIAPTVIIYILLSDRIVRAMAAGSLK
jgi:raffinose/stachyose/melibiose transport system permease protein